MNLNFRDPKLRQHYERTAAVVSDLPPEEVPVLALLDAWHWFQLIEGEDSPRAKEAVELLLLLELRPALRRWYQQPGSMNEGAIRFRDRLSALAGERFG